ncbi:adenylate kinase [Candidatus Liberibacter sp.]|uniref:adenylate kinase n=1 Tax=Candidatus Liberibacter sp. TaxID=34022 RepID=UPI0015F5911B|nr:adenylate kinase [Candidatus Liberibacter sp.]MBA5724244.1 adenylate kinase [Candidatus Liberibacter sp.]
MRIVFLGPPGVGKGTQAIRLSEKLGIPQLSTGDVLRMAIDNDTDVGRRIKKVMDLGGLVPDDVVNQVVADKIKCIDCSCGFILDGYPRTIHQAQALQSVLSDLGKSLDAVINLGVVDPEKMFKRIQNRVLKAASDGDSVRADDTYETFCRRLEEYREKTFPLSSYYRSIGCLYTVDGMLDVDIVTRSIDSVILSIGKNFCNS